MNTDTDTEQNNISNAILTKALIYKHEANTIQSLLRSDTVSLIMSYIVMNHEEKSAWLFCELIQLWFSRGDL